MIVVLPKTAKVERSYLFHEGPNVPTGRRTVGYQVVENNIRTARITRVEPVD